jgi:hypothetical protein
MAQGVVVPPLCDKEAEVTPPQRTLYLKIQVDPGVAPETAVFFPAKRTKNSDLDIVLYLHGVRDTATMHEYWKVEWYKFRELFNTVETDMVLVAPSLGLGSDARNLHGNWKVGGPAALHHGPNEEPAPAPHGLEKYLDTVLAGIQAHGSDQVGTAAPKIQNLFLAAHSWGGVHLLRLLAPLTTGGPFKYKEKLRECWGFDCVYGSHDIPDPETAWLTFCLTNRQVQVYVRYASTTERRCLNLDLMAYYCSAFRPVCNNEQEDYEPPCRDTTGIYKGNLWVLPSVEKVHHWVPYRYFPGCLQNNQLVPAVPYTKEPNAKQPVRHPRYLRNHQRVPGNAM